jgi:signal transduction histidine kinase/HAMP domain-containing protein
MKGTLFFLIAVVLVPLLILQSSVYYFWFYSSLKEQQRADIEFARVVAAGANEFVRDLVHQELALGTSLASLQPYTTEQANSLLTENLKDFPEVNFFSWVDLNGRTIAASNSLVMRINISGRQYFQEILHGHAWAASSLLIALADQSPIIVVGRGIYDKQNKLAGVVTAGVDPNKLDIFANLKIRTLENATWAVFDQEGNILYMNPQPHLNGAARNWRNKDPLLAEALKNGKEVVGELIWPLDGEKRLAARVPIGQTGWIAGTTLPKSAVTGPILKTLGTHLEMMGGIVLISVALALVISRRVVNPLLKLKEHASAIGRGNLEHRSEIAGTAEINELAHVFNMMAENLKETQFEREQYLIHLNGLILASEKMLEQTTMDGLLQQVVDSARDLTGARLGTAGHGYVSGAFRVGASSRTDDVPPCPPGQTFCVANGGVYMELIEKYDSIRLTDEQLRSSPSWWGLPQGHMPLRGVLGARMYDIDGKTNGLIMVSDKTDGEFTEEDEALLMQLAALASLALQHIDARSKAQAAASELAISNSDLEQFAYVASHDLQEPLRVITGYLQLLERRYKGRLDSNADEFIAFAVDAANRMQNLIVDLLAYSRISTRGRPFAEFDCNELLKQALANLEVAIKNSNAIVKYDPLPSVAVDGMQVVQVFQNLISNAIKFSGNKRPEISITAKHDTNEWVFSVKDKGIGIEPAYKDRIFVIFQRLHSRQEYPGTGIGLAICKKVIERHGGRIWVESETGKGSTFYFTIPERGA